MSSGPESAAWERLRTTVLQEWGFTRWFRIESPLTAPAFPDLIAFKNGEPYFIELKAWDASEERGFNAADVPWRAGQLVVLSQISRTGAKAYVLASVRVGKSRTRHWWIGYVGGDRALLWRTGTL